MAVGINYVQFLDDFYQKICINISFWLLACYSNYELREICQIFQFCYLFYDYLYQSSLLGGSIVSLPRFYCFCDVFRNCLRKVTVNGILSEKFIDFFGIRRNFWNYLKMALICVVPTYSSSKYFHPIYRHFTTVLERHWQFHLYKSTTYFQSLVYFHSSSFNQN